jgi:hypothetical protein
MFTQTVSARKLMATVFWYKKGVLMVEFMKQGTTITSQVYCEMLKNLCKAIQNKRRGMPTYGVVLSHDNVCPHIAACTWALLEHFIWEVFAHPSHSPDLAPRDYHLFTYLKNWLRSQRFNNYEELMECVKTWLSSQAQTSLTQAYENLFPSMTNSSISAVTILWSSWSM